MKFLIGSLVLMSGFFATATGEASSLKSSVRANIRDSIPGSKPRQSDRIDYPVPGKLTLSATQFCGDGDVANFATSHPNWDHQQGGSLKYVFGYWAVEDGASHLTPTVDNYFSSGVGTVDVGGSSLTTMTTSTGTNNAEILLTMNKAIGMIGSQLKAYRMNPVVSTKDKYRLFVGGMLCKAPLDPDPVLRDPLLVASEMNSIKDRIVSNSQFHSVVRTAATWDAVRAGISASLVDQGNTIKGTLGSGLAIQIGNDDVAGWAKSVFELSKPTASDLTGYKSAIAANSFLGDLKDFVDEFDNKATCAEVSKLDHDNKYPWEPYPLQFTCAAFNQDLPGKLAKALNDLMNPVSLPTDAEFKEKKSQLAEQLAIGLLMQNVQIAYRDRHEALPKQRCFGASPYIEKVMASIMFRAASGSAEFTMSHPEGGFAIGEYVPYYNSDEHTVFKMMNPKADASFGWNVVRGDVTPSASIFTPDKVVMKFNVRGVGCGQNVYCWNNR